MHWAHVLWSRIANRLTTQKRLDDTDELRQTRVRRQLRGLPPDHDPTAPRPAK
jgi:hypothetical protein